MLTVRLRLYLETRGMPGSRVVSLTAGVDLELGTEGTQKPFGDQVTSISFS